MGFFSIDISYVLFNSLKGSILIIMFILPRKAWSFGPRFFVLAKRRIYGMKLEFEDAIKNREYDVYESLESTVN